MFVGPFAIRPETFRGVGLASVYSFAGDGAVVHLVRGPGVAQES